MENYDLNFYCFIVYLVNYLINAILILTEYSLKY